MCPSQLSKYITHHLDLSIHEFLAPYSHVGKQKYFIGLLLIERKVIGREALNSSNSITQNLTEAWQNKQTKNRNKSFQRHQSDEIAIYKHLKCVPTFKLIKG